MSSSDINTSPQSLQIVLLLTHNIPPDDEPGTHPDTPDEELASSVSTEPALYTPVYDAQSVESSAPPSLLSGQGAHHDPETDITVPDEESGDGGSDSDSDTGSSTGASTIGLLEAHLLGLGLTPVFPGADGLDGPPFLMPQEPGTVAPPSTPVSGPVSQPVGEGVDDLGSIIAQSAQLAHLAPLEGAGTSLSGYHAGTSSAGSSTEESSEESGPEPAGSATPGDSDGSSSKSESDAGAAESPARSPNSPVLAGVPNGPDATSTVATPAPPRKSNFNAASAPFVPSGTPRAAPSPSTKPPEPPGQTQGSQAGGSGNAGLDTYAAGPTGKRGALSALAPEFALGEAMAWEAACPHGVGEARKAQVAASPTFQKHVGSNGVGGYGAGEGLVGGSGADGAGLGGQSAVGGCAAPGVPEPGHEPGLDGLGDGGQHSAGKFVQRADGSYTAAEDPPEHLPEPEAGQTLLLSGDGRILYGLAADGTCTAIGPTPQRYWLPEPKPRSEGEGGGESAQRLVLSGNGTLVYGVARDGSYAVIGPAPPRHWLPQPQPGPESQPEPEPEPEPEPVSEEEAERRAAARRYVRRIRARLEAPTPPPGYHVAVVSGGEPDAVFQYIILEDAPEGEDDDGGDSRPGTPDGPGPGNTGSGE